MADSAQEKSRRLTFAEQQLVRHGWEQGKGLGRDENGISEAIKVKVKCDKGGVGHKESEQFTFHWWDHVFNKASASLAVESGQDGVLVKKMEGAEEGMISNKKPRKAMMSKSVLYGSFVKSATLLSGKEQPECKSSCSEDSSSSEDEEKLDLSSTTKLSDAELVKACGGRTAHKGARHGLTMSAKLARLEQQELEFMAKYGPKLAGSPARTKAMSRPATPTSAPDDEPTSKTKRKKAYKEEEEEEEVSSELQVDVSHLPPPHREEEAARKKKKCSKPSVSPHSGDTPGTLVYHKEMNLTKPKEKKKRKRLEEITEPGEGQNGSSTLVLDEEHTGSMEQRESREAEPNGGAAHQLGSECVPKKKRKKKHFDQMAAEVIKGNGVVLSECYVQAQQEEGSVAPLPAHDGVAKKKKKKSFKPSKLEALAAELNALPSWDVSSTDTSNKTEHVELAVETVKSEGKGKKSDRKKRKQCRDEQEDGILNGQLTQPIEEEEKKKKKKKKYANSVV